MTHALAVDGLTKTYGSGSEAHTAIAGLSFSVDEGEFVSIVGPSGCGKTTLMKTVSGLLEPTDGSVEVFGQAVHSVPEGLAVVFQDYSRSLFPWLRIATNVAFPLAGRGLSKAERRERVDASLSAVGLDKFANRYPWQLSGGMQQRVAIARALAYQPRLLLMDEPFASVDAQTRAELEDLALKVHKEFGMTILFVTHDIDESVYLARRVIVLRRSPGRVLAELTVDLPAERDQIATKELPQFVGQRAEVARLIRAASQDTVVEEPPVPALRS